MPFICAVDCVFGGLTASWRDEDGKPVIYETTIEAELDAADTAIEDDDEPDMVIEVVVTDEQIYDPVDGRIYWEKK